MSSFYMTLNSEGSRDIHPDNHGGDFTVELHDTLDLAGAWEVALMEVAYFEKIYGNLDSEYGEMAITSTKAIPYPTKFVATHDKVDHIAF